MIWTALTQLLTAFVSMSLGTSGGKSRSVTFFLIPFFLNGQVSLAIPLSALVGTIFGALAGWGIYYADGRMKNKISLAIFFAGLLHLLSTGLFVSGCYKFEAVYGSTPVVWQLHRDLWSINRLPMTIFKPFGYSDTRTVLQMVCF